MISIFSLIYRSPRWGAALLESLQRATPELSDGRAEFYWIACRADTETLRWVRSCGFRYIRHDPPVLDEMPEGMEGPEYLRAVYGGLNVGITAGSEKVIPISSDHAFTAGWLESLNAAWSADLALSPLTIEPGGGKHLPFPADINGTGAVHRDLGRRTWEMDAARLEAVAAELRRPVYSDGGAHQPTLMLREAAMDVGGYPEGNPKGDYGDRAFFSAMAVAGVHHRTWHGSVVYHVGEGEMGDP